MLSSANDRYLECLIALQSSLINKYSCIYIYICVCVCIKVKDLKRIPVGTPPKNLKCKEKVPKMHTEECRLVRRLRNQFT
jgi:hypothetical protein